MLKNLYYEKNLSDYGGSPGGIEQHERKENKRDEERPCGYMAAGAQHRAWRRQGEHRV